MIPNHLYPLDLQHLTSVYLALHISGGQIGLPVVVMTASICRKVIWHSTIINFCIIWTVYSVIHCVYLYAGVGIDDRNSKFCLAQASMIYGTAPMAVVAGLAIVFHTWTTLQCPECPVLGRIPRPLYSILMLGTPYLVFFVFSVGAGIFVTSQPQSVAHRPALVVPSFCAAIMIIILALEAVITVQYYRQWKIIKTSFPLATRTPSRSICFRLGLFPLHSCVTLTSVILSLSDVQTEVTYMLPAALPLGAFVVFGSREGLISLWATLLRGQRHSSSSSETVLPSARAASVSDPTSTPDGLCLETPEESSESV